MTLKVAKNASVKKALTLHSKLTRDEAGYINLFAQQNERMGNTFARKRRYKPASTKPIVNLRRVNSKLEPTLLNKTDLKEYTANGHCRGYVKRYR